MRLNVLLAAALTTALAASLVNGCGSSGSSDTGKGNGSMPTGDGGPTFGSSPDGGGDDGGGVGHVLSGVHIVPANAKLVVQAGQSASLPYTVMGIVDGATAEIDVTSRFVFYVPDNYLVGGFPRRELRSSRRACPRCRRTRRSGAGSSPFRRRL